MTVSIILPTRDRPNWLPRAVASVLHQTDWQWQLVILDNSDEPYYRHSPWFDHRIVYSHQRCEGIADAYANALELATGDVIAPLGDDDILTTGCVARIRQVFADPAVMWANARTQIVDDHGATVAMRGGDQESVDRTRAGSYWLGGAVWWRRELTADRAFDPAFEGAADFDLYLRFLEQAEPVLVDEVMYVYQDWAGTDSRLRFDRQQAQSHRIAREWAERRTQPADHQDGDSATPGLGTPENRVTKTLVPLPPPSVPHDYVTIGLGGGIVQTGEPPRAQTGRAFA